MGYTLDLIETLASGESETKRLALTDSVITTEYVKVQVYDDAKYDFEIGFDNPNLFHVGKFIVEVNGEKIYDDTPEIISNGNEPLKVRCKTKNYVKAFATCYDYCQITVEATIDKKEYSLMSEDVICLNRAFFGRNIRNMLSYLFEQKNEEIDKALFRTKSTELFAIDEYSEDQKTNNDVTKESFLRYIKDVTSYFEKHFIEFKAKPHQAIRQKSSIISASRAKRISHQDIEWLAKNSENLVKVNTRTGVRFGKSYFMPLRIKSLDREITFNTYENRAIVSFLQTMHLKVRKVIDGISQINDTEEENISRLANFEDKDYKVASLELRRWNVEDNKTLIKEYELQERRLKRLIRSYEELFEIHGEMINKVMPKRTKVFAQVGHYKQAYNIMFRWRNVDLSFNKYIAVNRIKSVSEIYEYYCLVKIIEMLINHGFELQTLPVEDASYEYEELLNYEHKMKVVANTYVLTNADFIVKLYYEPKIYSYHSEKSNDITIYRTDVKTNFYTPDYLLTFLKKDSDYIRHVIIDAKYKSASDALYSLSNDIIQKYYLNVGCQGENEKISMVWVINGKFAPRDDEYYIERYQKASLLDRFVLTPSFGVCGLASRENNLEKLYEEISLQVGC